MRGRWSRAGALVGGLAMLAVAACGAEPESAPAGQEARPTTAGTGAVAYADYEVCWEAPAGGSGRMAFEDRTRELGLVSPLAGMMAHAAAAGDVNNDGWVDLFVGTFADRPAGEYAGRGASGPSPDRLLLGSPEGFRVDESFPEMRGRSSGAVFADLDADGDLDLVIARNPRTGERQNAPSVVMRNDDGRFTEAFVLDRERGFRSIGVLDVDGDGLLDLFVVEDKWSGGSSVLYRNDGDLRFSDVTSQVGLPADVHGLGVSTVDLNGDRWPDLFVSGSNRLFLHNGDAGTFREDKGSDFTWETYGKEDDPAGVVARDLDGDGRPELVVGQHYNSTLDDGQRVPIRVYANRAQGDGVRFVDVTEEARLIGLPTKSPHVEVADLDADGRPDLVTTAAASGAAGPVVFRNVTRAAGELRFEAVSAPGGEQYWVTGAVVDADRDGALEVLLAEWFPAKPSLMLSATGERGHWLAVELGVAGTAGVGAVVSVYEAGHAGDEKRLLGRTEISAQTGYGAGAEPVARFGLGEVTTVDVEIRPPRSETVETLREVAADRWIRVGAPCP